ncbi:MAG: T9SS type A sorting domain-containing protein [Bacteroidetes bacterium]|nr:T9SS type A sorting domain-containing protein [Bacteroidota bacterium]MBK9800374.1 T9SS type A sorting domain-containing protein [Bacteroidota bacterium]
MRHKFYFGLLLIFFFVNTNLFAQNFWVPDANFRNALKQVCPGCFTAQDSLITNSSSIQSVQNLYISNLNISSLDGIGYFTSLLILHCAQNQLPNLPVLPATLTQLVCAFNQLTSLPILPDSLDWLECYSNQLSNLPGLPPTLTYLNCDNNQLTSLPALPPTLTDLECQNNQLTSLPALPATLTILLCYDNQLSSLPALPATLVYLYCFDNQLTSLPPLPALLVNLFCGTNQLTSLPALPASLEYLNCGSNQLTNLPALPATLTSLKCPANQLTSLPALPATLEKLWCYDNQLASLPALPATLEYLWCYENQLTSLPALPATLTALYSDNNQLTSLPALPSSLTLLLCTHNQLTSLPALPSTLKYLNCYNNQLTSLPALPASLEELYCYSNQLTSLPAIPGFTRRLDCSYNPITCFPKILPRSPGSQNWTKIRIDSTLISCIPNQNSFPLSLVQSSPPFPFCSPVNSICNYNFTSGYVFMDVNGDGIKDSLENGIPIPVYYSGNYGSWPDSAGFFNSISDTGNITFQVNVPTYHTSTTPASQTVHVVTGSVDTLYFGLQPIPNINDLKMDLTSITFLRPGFKAKYKIHYQNVGTEIISNVNVKFLKPSQLSNLSAFPTANTINGDTLIWNIASLNPFQQGDIVITDSVFVNATLGDTANAYAWIEPITGDSTPQNNSSKSTNIIRGSFDPNDKAVSPEVVLPNTTGYLEYIIRFQNTGTDTAFAVMVIDTLSSLLNVSSMEMISASHSYDLWIENGVAKWNFINILLPDSNTNELESHGFVKFGIKPKPGLTVTDSIQNKADIYFDYNAAVSTNTIVVNVLNPLQVKDLKETELQVFPNPVQDILRIVNQHAGALGKIELINANGKVLETKTISTSTYTWNIQHLPAGTYILKGQGWGQKVVKE